MPAAPFISSLLTPPTPVSGGRGTPGSPNFSAQRQQQRQFEEQMKQRQLEAEQRNALAQQQFGLNQARLAQEQAQFEAQREVVRQKILEEARAELDAAMLSGNQDAVDVAVQKLRRLGEDITDATAQPQQPLQGAPMSPEAAQLEKATGFQETMRALGGAPATAGVLQGQPPPGNEQAPLQGQAAPSPPVRPPGFDFSPAPPPAALRAKPGEAPFSGPPAPPNAFTGAAFQVPPSEGPALSHQVREPGVSLAGRMTQTGQSGLVVRDDSGNVVGQYDPEGIKRRAVQEVESTFAALEQEATTEEEARAARAAKGVSMNMIGQRSIDPKEAVRAGLNLYNRILGRDTAKTVAGRGSGATGFSGKGSITEGSGLTNMDLRLQGEARQIANNMAQRYGVTGLNQAAHEGAQLAAKIDSPNAVSQNEAINTLVRLAQGSRPSDADREFTLKSGGQMNLWRTKVNGWIASGQLPPDFRRQIKEYANVLMAYNLELQAAIMERSMSSIRSNPVFGRLRPEDQEGFANWVGGHSTGDFQQTAPIEQSEEEEDDIMAGFR